MVMLLRPSNYRKEMMLSLLLSIIVAFMGFGLATGASRSGGLGSWIGDNVALSRTNPLGMRLVAFIRDLCFSGIAYLTCRVD